MHFKKVRHPGCHQDYRIYFAGVHIGNIRKIGKNHWSARSDFDGYRVLVRSSQSSRWRVAQMLGRALVGMGWDRMNPNTPRLMQQTKDVGDE